MALNALLRDAHHLVDSVRTHSVSNQTTTTATQKQPRGSHGLNVCTECFSRFYWRPRSGSWRCMRCDPPLVESMVAARTHIEFETLSDWRRSRLVEIMAMSPTCDELEAMAILDLILHYAQQRSTT